VHLYSVSTWHSSQVFRLLTKDQRATLPTRLFHMWSYSTSNPVSTQMGDHLRAGILSRYVTSHRRQLSLLPSVGREMSTVRWCSAAGSKYNGSFDSWINVWVAVKTVWSLVNKCRSGYRPHCEVTEAHVRVCARMCVWRNGYLLPYWTGIQCDYSSVDVPFRGWV